MTFTCDDQNLVCPGPVFCRRCTREYELVAMLLGAVDPDDDGVRDDPPPPSADELARKQRVVDAIGTYMAKPPKPPRRWRR